MKQYKIKIIYKFENIGQFMVQAESRSKAEDKAFDYSDLVLSQGIKNYDPEEVELYFLDDLSHKRLFEVILC